MVQFYNILQAEKSESHILLKLRFSHNTLQIKYFEIILVLKNKSNRKQKYCFLKSLIYWPKNWSNFLFLFKVLWCLCRVDRSYWSCYFWRKKWRSMGFYSKTINYCFNSRSVFGAIYGSKAFNRNLGPLIMYEWKFTK